MRESYRHTVPVGDAVQNCELLRQFPVKPVSKAVESRFPQDSDFQPHCV